MDAPKRILIVDDNEEALFALGALLESRGFEVVSATTGEEALRVAVQESDTLSLILLDVNLPKMGGYEVARRVKADPNARFVPLMLLTANAALESVLEGLQAGADSYLTKPYQSEELLARMHAMLRMREVLTELRLTIRENHTLRALVESRTQFPSMIGQSRVMQEVCALIEKIRGAEVPVLITGESGTGKELVARAIHEHSPRQHKPFVVQNCGALHENLLESELFGHVKGAFTGAIRDKRGLFEVADGGTFFLDELGEMSPSLQVKLLRVLQEGTFTPVGGTSVRSVDVRIIAATHRNLPELIAKGQFREDLYYRLNVIGVKLPPLRDRRDDIPLLVAHFLRSPLKGLSGDSSTLRCSDAAMRILQTYSYPGNIRQLQNEIARARIMAAGEGEIRAEHLSDEIRASSAAPLSARRDDAQSSAETPSSLPEALRHLERSLIEAALRACGGNKSKAATQLGISRTNLIKKVQAHGISDVE